MNDQNQVSKDLRRSARQTKRIDYKAFNQTGVIKEVQFLDETVAADDEDIIDNTSISNNEGHFIDNTLINIPILILTYKKYQTFSIISTYFHVFQLWIKRRYHNFKQNNNLSR